MSRSRSWFRRAAEPVFVDRSGRRRRLTVLAGAFVGVVLASGLVVIFAGLVTGAPPAPPGWPDSSGGRDVPAAEGIAPAPAPAPPADPEPVDGSDSAAEPDPTAATTDAPGAGETTPADGQPGEGSERRGGRATPPGHDPSKSPGKPGS